MRKIKKTKWLPIHTKPARSGLYECDCGLLHYYSQSTKEWYADILDFRLGHKLYVEDWRMWRGLTEKVDDRGTAGKLPNVGLNGERSESARTQGYASAVKTEEGK